MPVGYPKVKNARPKTNRINRTAKRAQRTLLPLVAVGGSLAGMPASALELGDLTVQSRLGQPLRASIAVALAPNEQLADSCVTLAAGASASGLPGIGRATISIGDGAILLNGKTPIREPMVAAHLVVDCAYTANLSREYMLFIDPADPVTETRPVAEASSAAPTAPTHQSAPAVARRAPVARTVNREPIGKSTRYHVQFGDTLGDIAARIENRSIGLWPAADKIFDANREAFIDNDPNKLKAASWLNIPSFDGTEPVVSETAPRAISYAERAANDALTSATTTLEAPESEQTSAVTTPSVETTEATPAEVVADTTTDLRPGDIVLDNDNPFVDGAETVNENIVIPNTEISRPTTISASPNVPTAIITTSSQESSTPWLTWLAGSGIVMIIGLILFGRRFRERNSAPPLVPVQQRPARRSTDYDGENVEAVASPTGDREDDTPTEENLTLDADLIAGTGLHQTGGMDIAQDFGFASPTEVDIELPFEPEPEIAFDRSNEDTILDSEILPDDEDYDLSVIIDATKMPQPEDITERDLKAIELPDGKESTTTDSYTINKEVDFDILERDYEDELTATQALNVEIARAALELSDTGDGETPDDETEELRLASVTELDATAQMPSRDEIIDELSDEDYLVETATGMMIADDGTVEMPSADNDDSKELDVEGGKIDTKAL